MPQSLTSKQHSWVRLNRLPEPLPLQEPLPPRLLDQLTLVTPTLSEALPPMFSEDEPVA